MARLSARSALVAGAALAALGACSPKDNGTLLVVRVDTDLAIPAQIDTVEIGVVPERGSSSKDSYTLTGGAGLPVTLGLRPKGDPNFGVEVTARGLLAGTMVVSQTAAVRFAPGKEREFTLFLSSDCLTGGGCTTPNVCVRGPSCVAKTNVAQLRDYVPGGGQDAGAEHSPTDAPTADGSGGTGGAGDSGSPTDGPAVEAHPNPGMWVAVPGVPAVDTLSAIWPVSDKDVWVAGAQAAGVILHYDGAGWNPSPIPAGTPALYGLWGTPSGDLWAVGTAGTVLHLANNVWQSMKVPAMGAATLPTLTAVWGAKPDDIWIVGAGGKIFHVDGTGTISAVSSGVTAGLFAVGGSAQSNGDSDVWAVGQGGTILHLTNGSWMPVTQALTQAILYGVWSDAPANVWIAGDRIVLHGGGAGPWKAVPGSVDVSLAIWGSEGDDIWTVGRGAAGGPTIARWDGVSFMGAAEGSGSTLQAVHGSSATNVWAAGAAGAVFRFQPN
jgi:hypothetical protein